MGTREVSAFIADNEDEVQEMVERFVDYQPRACDRPSMVRWLSQFRVQHFPLALKLASVVRYYGGSEFTGTMRKLHGLVEEEVQGIGATLTDVLFVPFGRTAESGQFVAGRYRNANRLQNRGNQFVQTAELAERVYRQENPVVVFLDDFIGTGKQVSDGWHEVLSQLVPESDRLYVAVAAAFRQGRDKIQEETPLKVISVHELGAELSLMDGQNTRLSDSEKRTIKRYCTEWGNHPLGFGDKGLLVSFCHGTPNNAPSVIRGASGQRRYKGLLPGYADM